MPRSVATTWRPWSANAATTAEPTKPNGPGDEHTISGHDISLAPDRKLLNARPARLRNFWTLVCIQCPRVAGARPPSNTRRSYAGPRARHNWPFKLFFAGELWPAQCISYTGLVS